jgi:hypothetical protein
MRGSRKKTIVRRHYAAAPDNCARALQVLLETPVHKHAAEFASEPSRVGEVKHEEKEVHHVEQRNPIHRQELSITRSRKMRTQE